MVNLNGTVLKKKETNLSVENRGYHYGDALFETIRAVHGKIIFWEDHYFRLMASMRIMRMEIPMDFSPEFLESKILSLIKTNKLLDKPVRIKINIHRKAGGLYRPDHRAIGYLIQVSALGNPSYILNDPAYEVELFKDHFVHSGLLSTIKTNNKAVHVLGSIYAEENDFQNCLLLNEKKSVVEALNGNLFLAKGNSIKTPPLSDGCLNGIIRKKLIGIVEKSPGFSLREESISSFELQKADELFLTNVIVGIQPVSKYRKKVYESKIARDLLSKLNLAARPATNP